MTHAEAFIKAKAEELIALANIAGVHVRIDRAPMLPLAQGNCVTYAEVWTNQRAAPVSEEQCAPGELQNSWNDRYHKIRPSVSLNDYCAAMRARAGV